MMAHRGLDLPSARGSFCFVTGAIAFVAAFSGLASAQPPHRATAPSNQTAVSVGASSASDSFYEMQGISWSLVGPNWFARFGPRPPVAAPAFGNFPGDGGATFGFGHRGDRVQGEFFGRWPQGYRSAATFQSPSLMLSDGAYGWWWDASAAPFVMGVVPVVGDRPAFPEGRPSLHDPQSNVLERSHALSAATSIGMEAPQQNQAAIADDADGDDAASQHSNAPNSTSPTPRANLSLSGTHTNTATDDAIGPSAPSRAWSTAVSEGLGVEEAARLRAAELATQNQEAESFLRKASAALEAGRIGTAETYCRMALARAVGDVRTAALQLQHRIAAVRGQCGP
ncbi:hypothetical protein [Thermopirellula anaerolimosa]